MSSNWVKLTANWHSRFRDGYPNKVNRSRGIRQRREKANRGNSGNPGGAVIEGIQEYVDPALSRSARQARAKMIQKIDAVDPIVCPERGGKMLVSVVIEENTAVLPPSRRFQHRSAKFSC